MCTANEKRFQNCGSLTTAMLIAIVDLYVDVLFGGGCIDVRKCSDYALTASRNASAKKPSGS